MNYQDMTDTDLIERFVRGGEAIAFNHLIQRHRPQILAHATRMLSDASEAESAAQEVSIRLFLNLNKFESSAQFTTWLYRITENVVLTAIAKRNSEQRKLDALTTEVNEEVVPAGENEASFVCMIKDLANDEQQIIAMRFQQDREISDIARITGNGLSATKMRLYRALDKLRESHNTLPTAA